MDARHVGRVIAGSLGFLVRGVPAEPVGDSKVSVWSKLLRRCVSPLIAVTDWSANDYFDFTTDAAGFENLSISFNLLQVGTPPLTFSVLYGVAGSAMIDSGVDVVADLTSFVVAKTALLSDPSVQGESLVIRIVANSDASAPLNSVRIDDVQILGDAIATPVPEPSAAVPWLVLGAAAVFRRKLRNKG